MIRPACLLFAGVLCAAVVAGARAELAASTNFEGGSAREISIDQATQTIRFMPGGDPARGWPCWWFLRVDGAADGATIALELVGSDRELPANANFKARPLSVGWATPKRAAVSYDGVTWEQSSPGEKRLDGMTWKVEARGSKMWVAWGPAFTPAHSKELVDRIAATKPFAERFVLSRTREGREVPAVCIRQGEKPEAERFGVWVAARQHAWESGASWVCRGFAEWLTGDSAEAIWLRENAQIYVVPVMDVDHVATGDGGKEALPQDHNRDWSDAPHWPEVAAAQQRLAQLAAQDRLDVFLDLHNPSAGDLGTYFYTGEGSLLSATGVRNRDRFLALAREHLVGPIPYDPKPRASGVNYHPLWRQISGNWVSTHGNPHTLSLCLETAWNTPFSTTKGYLATGSQLGACLTAYLRENPRR